MTNKTATMTQGRAASPARPPELEQLEMFLGTWHAEGESLPDSPVPGRMTTRDSYEWFPGGFFLVDRGELRIDNHEPDRHLWIFGYDASSRTYPIHAFDSQGFVRVYQARVRDRTWTFAGEWERATLVFSKDGRGYRAKWELTKDGSTWLPLCDVTATKVT